MEFLVLGPLAVRDGDRAQDVDGHRRRALLALLLARRGRTVPLDDLEDALWPDGPPRTARHTLHTHVSRLRRDLGVPVDARDGGYALDVPAEAVDAGRFEALLDAAEAVPPRSAGDTVAYLEEALALWRGRAYGGAADLPGVRADARRLQTRRLEARERLVSALLLAGRATDAVVVAESLAADEPARETAWAALIRALVAAGRPADGVAAYHRAAAELAELGLLPAAALREAQAEALAAPDRPRGPRADDHPHATPDRSEGPTVPPGTTAPPPSTWSPLVGREADVRAVQELLTHARLVTLLGPGGVGKTRLALEVLRTASSRHGSGTRFVDLATVHDASAVAASTVSALGVTTDAGPTAAALRRAGGLDVLVLLDNCEHVLDAVAEVVEELMAGGRARVLATSRERIGVPAERVHPVRPLSTDADGAARRLFLERAVAAGADLTDEDPALVDAVVRQLDGLPLAIEMAAARTATTGLRELADALRADPTDLRNPHRRGTERHRTLRGVFEWSERLLDAPQRQTLEGWPVLAGPVPLEDAVAVLGVEPRTVEDLVARSLLVLHPTPGGTTRYRMLHTVRAAVQDDPAVATRVRAGAGRHARHFTAVAASADEAMRGPDEPQAVRRVEGVLADLRAAHSWAAGHEPALAAELSRHLHAFSVSTLADEVLQWGARLVPLLAEEDRAQGQVAAATRLSVAGELAAATSRALAALAGARHPSTRWAALEVLADAAGYDGRLEDCARYGEQLRAEAAEHGDRLYLAMGGTSLALALAYGEEHAAARAELATTTALLDRLGPAPPSAHGWLEYAAGEIEPEADPGRAAEHLRRAISLADVAGNRYLGGVARVAETSLRSRHGDPAEAARSFADVVRRWLDQGNRTHLLTTLRNLVELLVRLERDEDAAELWGAVMPATLTQSFGAERRRLDRARDVLGDRLGDEVVAQAVRRGEARTLEDAAEAARAALASGTVPAP